MQTKRLSPIVEEKASANLANQEQDVSDPEDQPSVEDQSMRNLPKSSEETELEQQKKMLQ